MNQCVETVSQVFLGARLQCAKCHNHPFELDPGQLLRPGAFFHRVQRRLTQRPGEMFVYTSFSGDVTQPRTGQVMAPWLPQVGSIETRDDVDRRLAFTEWLVSPDNPYFARIEVNRIWSQLFTRGIVEPIDDFRDSNPPSNDQLLDALAKDFVESGFDRKHLLRVLLNSRTYQASFQPNDSNREDGKYFSHQEPRLLAAEQLLDAINHTLSLDQNLGHLPQGTRATQLPAPDLVKVDFLKVFGQPERARFARAKGPTTPTWAWPWNCSTVRRFTNSSRTQQPVSSDTPGGGYGRSGDYRAISGRPVSMAVPVRAEGRDRPLQNEPRGTCPGTGRRRLGPVQYGRIPVSALTPPSVCLSLRRPRRVTAKP